MAFTDIDVGSFANDPTADDARTAFQKINDNFALAANQSEDNTFSGKNVFEGFITLGAGTSAAIASGALTIDSSYITVSTEDDLADNLDTITMSGGNMDGTLLILKKASGTGTITVTTAGNILLGDTSRVLDFGRDKLMLIYDSSASKWTEVSFTSN